MQTPNKEKQRLLSTSKNTSYTDPKEDECKVIPGGIGQDQFTLSLNKRVTYSWESMEVFLDVKPRNLISRLCNREKMIKKRILHNVTGVVRPGEFLAIMGASGAGKTTLLNCLTFRNTGKLHVSGQRFINGSPIDIQSLAHMSAYIQQDDLFIGTLTVREQLRFKAMLRMDKFFTFSERMSRVEQVIHELGLVKIANTKIGNPVRGIKGISGGESKRLAFGCEILTDPPLMFCDEPTSGLDSYMAQNVVQVLKNLASSGKTIICTIHQPSSEVFSMFDRILLMAEGRTAYLGPVEKAFPFLSAQGLHCPTNFNPADFYIHALAAVSGKELESHQQVLEICDAFQMSTDGREIQRLVQENHPNVSNFGMNGQLVVPPRQSRSPYKASWYTQFTAVFRRSWISLTREPAVLRVKAFQTIFISSLIALIYQDQQYNMKSLPNIQGALFVFLTNVTFQNVFGVVNVITNELPIFLRENLNGMYRTDVYFLSKTLADLPIYIFFPFIFVTIPYFAIGLNPAIDRYFTAALIVIMVANAATSFGNLFNSHSLVRTMFLNL